MVAGVVWVAQRSLPYLKPWVVVPFAIFLLSPKGFILHFCVLCTSIHFALFFFLCTVALPFDERQRNSHLTGGGLCAILSAYFLASGVVYAAVLVGFLSPSKSTGSWSPPIREPSVVSYGKP